MKKYFFIFAVSITIATIFIRFSNTNEIIYNENVNNDYEIESDFYESIDVLDI